VRRLGVAGFVLGLLAASAGAAPPPGGGGRIVFASDRAVDLHRTRFAAVTPSGGRTLEVGIAPEGAALAPDRRRYAYVERTPPSTFRLLVGSFAGDTPVVVATLSYAIRNPVWSPVGDRLAYTAINPASCGSEPHLCATFELWVASASGGDAQKVADRAADPVWSPNGTRVAFAGEYITYDANDGWKGRPYVADRAGGNVHRLANIHGVDALSWAPRSDRVVVSAHAGFVAIVPVRGGGARKLGPAKLAVWSPRGDAIAVARPDGTIALLRPDGHVLRRIRTAGRVERVVWSPRADQLAYLARAKRTAAYGPQPPHVLATVSSTGRNTRTISRFDRFEQARVHGWLREGYVLYSTTREQNDWELYSMRSDGSDVRQLTDDDRYESDPAWSPDARRIAFTRPSDESIPRNEIWTIAADGTDVRRVTVPSPGTEDRDPTWSPDGRQLAFARSHAPEGGSNNVDVWIAAADGSALHQLTHGGGLSPSWSPDGRRIVFARPEGFSYFLHSVNIDGSGEERLSMPVGALWPAWSPDGRRIAYVAPRGVNVIGLWVANVDGSSARLLTEDPFGSPSWSPDGTALVFYRMISDPATGLHGQLYTVSVDGGRVGALSSQGTSEQDPDWSRALP